MRIDAWRGAVTWDSPYLTARLTDNVWELISTAQGVAGVVNGYWNPGSAGYLSYKAGWVVGIAQRTDVGEIQFRFSTAAATTEDEAVSCSAPFIFTNDGIAKIDTIQEASNDNGVDIEGVPIKDGLVDGRDVATDGGKLDGIEALADVTDATNVAAAGAVMDSDFSANGAMERTGAGAYATILNKRDATTAPTANDDSGDGYSVGSRWVDVTGDKEYVCLDATLTAAVWTETTQSGGGGL